MIILPIYRPEITVWHREPDGQWESTHGTQTNTLFYPLRNQDRELTEAGFLKSVEHGEEPFCRIEVPDGSELIERGRTLLLRLADGKCHDAINALVLARIGAEGFYLIRDRPRPVAVQELFPAARPTSKGKVRQLALFGGEEGSP